MIITALNRVLQVYFRIGAPSKVEDFAWPGFPGRKHRRDFPGKAGVRRSFFPFSGEKVAG
jgi:hypothetical protein